jgi:hypothetical protein
VTWTYDVSQLATSDLMKVRNLVGDTNTTDPLQQDEEINFALTERGTVYGAAAMVCRTLAAKFARDSDVASQDMRTSLSQRSSNFLRLAKEYEPEAAAAQSGPAVLVAGLPSWVAPQ